MTNVNDAGRAYQNGIKKALEIAKARLDPAPMDDFDDGWNAALNMVIAQLDKSSENTEKNEL